MHGFCGQVISDEGIFQGSRFLWKYLSVASKQLSWGGCIDMQWANSKLLFLKYSNGGTKVGKKRPWFALADSSHFGNGSRSSNMISHRQTWQCMRVLIKKWSTHHLYYSSFQLTYVCWNGLKLDTTKQVGIYHSTSTFASIMNVNQFILKGQLYWSIVTIDIYVGKLYNDGWNILRWSLIPQYWCCTKSGINKESSDSMKAENSNCKTYVKKWLVRNNEQTLIVKFNMRQSGYSSANL